MGCKMPIDTLDDHCQRSHGHGPLARYVKLQVAHAPGMLGTFSPPLGASYPDMHHGTCVTHVPWCMPGSLTSGFFEVGGREKRSRHSRRMRNPQFCLSGKRPMGFIIRVPTCWQHNIVLGVWLTASINPRRVVFSLLLLFIIIIASVCSHSSQSDLKSIKQQIKFYQIYLP